MNIYGLDSQVVDPAAVERTAQRFREQRIVLPTFGQLANPAKAPSAMHALLSGVDRNAGSPANLWRVHWFNKLDGGLAEVPEHVVLTRELTGVDAPIVVAFGDRFPMIGAHKVLAAYACLAPRLVTGTFDPTRHRAIWPSTGNYCRGGVAVSRVMGCRGVAVLPEGMSRERFDWLERWVVDESDIIKTPGTESNVKEIYDRCHELAEDPDNVILNQFCEFGNHLVHRLATGAALEGVVEHLVASRPELKVRAFVSATGSAGTIGAGDHLKDRFGSLTVAVEALECPTLLNNGFGEHNIQGIGDKHVPLIHNVMRTDVVIAISDRATDSLNVLASTDVGRGYLASRGVPPGLITALSSFGLSSWCNVLAAIKLAKRLHLGGDDLVVTVATDGAAMYQSELSDALRRDWADGFTEVCAAQVFGEHLLGAGEDHLLECTDFDRNRIFNLGYYTWVEQQGVSIEEFEARRDQSFWRSLLDLVPVWDDLITELNGRSGAVPAA
ncbi:MAG: pyridoxal-phosphate dependent enzyme [Acidimicrobiales bacterium]